MVTPQHMEQAGYSKAGNCDPDPGYGMERRKGLIDQNDERIKQRSGCDQSYRRRALMDKSSDREVRGIEQGGISC